MNTQILLIFIVVGLLVGQLWYFLLTSPSLWRKRKGLTKEQRTRLYFLRAWSLMLVLSMARLLSGSLVSAASEPVSAEYCTLLVTVMGAASCVLGSCLLLVQRKRETPEYSGRFFIAVGLFALVTNFLIS